jgi:hypothetical protein
MPRRKNEETVAALSALCQTPSELVETVMNDSRAESDFRAHLGKGRGTVVANRKTNMHLAPQDFSLLLKPSKPRAAVSTVCSGRLRSG